MKDWKEELAVLSAKLDNLREAMNHSLDTLGSEIENAIKEANNPPEVCRLVPFDIERAKQGAKIVTTLGENVRILCYDRKSSLYPIVALIESREDDEESIENYTKEGKAYIHQDRESDLRILE